MRTEHLSLKERLAIHGYEVRRVCTSNGTFRGISIHDSDGNQVHEKKLASYEYGLKLVQEKEKA